MNEWRFNSFDECWTISIAFQMKNTFRLFIYHVHEFWMRTPPPPPPHTHTHKITVNAALINLSFNAKHMSMITCPFAIEFFDVKQNHRFWMLKPIYIYSVSQDTQGSYTATDIPYQWCTLRIYPSDLAKIQNWTITESSFRCTILLFINGGRGGGQDW